MSQIRNRVDSASGVCKEPEVAPCLTTRKIQGMRVIIRNSRPRTGLVTCGNLPSYSVARSPKQGKVYGITVYSLLL